MAPTIGRIVHYRLTADEAARLSVAGGNTHEAGQVVPLVIVRVWGEGPEAAFNGRAFGDGTASPLWVTSTKIGDRNGECSWPVAPK